MSNTRNSHKVITRVWKRWWRCVQPRFFSVVRIRCGFNFTTRDSVWINNEFQGGDQISVPVQRFHNVRQVIKPAIQMNNSGTCLENNRRNWMEESSKRVLGILWKRFEEIVSTFNWNADCFFGIAIRVHWRESALKWLFTLSQTVY